MHFGSRSRLVSLGVALLFCPLSLKAQGCLGLSPEPNSGGLDVELGHQGDGQRVGASVNANIAGRVGMRIGMRWGALSSFAEGGYEARGLLAIPLFKNATNVCVFGEYEQSHDPFVRALGMNTGHVTDYWIHLGYAVAGDIGRLAGVRLTLNVAPELILRRTHIRGRVVYTEPDVHVMEHVRVWGDWYLGGRAMISARYSKYNLSWGLQNRPRIWSDLHWFFRLGFRL